MSDPRLDGLTRVSVRDARRMFADLINRAAYGVERIVVERHGKPIAAIVCVEDLDHLEAQDAALDAKMLQALRTKRRKARAAHRRSPTAARRG